MTELLFRSCFLLEGFRLEMVTKESKQITLMFISQITQETVRKKWWEMMKAETIDVHCFFCTKIARENTEGKKWRNLPYLVWFAFLIYWYMKTRKKTLLHLFSPKQETACYSVPVLISFFLKFWILKLIGMLISASFTTISSSNINKVCCRNYHKHEKYGFLKSSKMALSLFWNSMYNNRTERVAHRISELAM